MKILHVLPGMDPKMGGVVQAVCTIVASLSDSGITNEIVCMDDPGASYITNSVCKINAVGAGKGPWCYNKELVPWLCSNALRFDVLVVHGLWQYHTYAVRKAIMLCKKQNNTGAPKNKLPRVYIMPHGMLDPYFQRAKGRKIKAIRNWFFWKLVEGKFIADANALLFTCEEECRLAREPFTPYLPKKEMVVGLGIEDPPGYAQAMKQAFYEKCPELSDGRPYLLFLSRIHEKKGVDLLINAYASLLKQWNQLHTDALLHNENSRQFPFNESLIKVFPSLVIAGPGLESPYGHKIKKMVDANSSLSCRVSFPGMLSGDAKWGAYYGCQVFVLLSHQENFGVAVVEAMACAKPVIITDQINIWKEIVASGGGLVTGNNLVGGIGVLEKWMKLNDDEKLLTGKKSRLAFEKYYAIKPVAKKFLSAIDTGVKQPLLT